MASKTEQKIAEPLNAELKAVEEWMIINQTPEAVFHGVLADRGWRSGKMLTNAEYVNAVSAFLQGGMDGRKG